MSKLVEKILVENEYVLPSHLRNSKSELAGLSTHYIDINKVFMQKFNPKYVEILTELYNNYYKNNCVRKYDGGFYETGMKLMIVNINDIYPGQDGINSEILIRKMNQEKASIEKPSEFTPKGPIGVMLHDTESGEDIILCTDGHHRIAEAILKGRTKIEMNIKVDKFR